MTEQSDLEKEFKESAEKYSRLIAAKVAQACQLLSEACAISEEHGIPFDSNISFLSQGYVPDSFATKFKGLDREIMYEVTGVYNEYEGWQHSQVC
jgi:hypothetical protein